jgi:outer membrane receptor protein involved in Fe transport
MKKRTGLSALLFSCLFFTAFASKDTAKITGKVLDDKNQPVPFANVILYASADSAMVKAEYTKEDGSFELLSVPAGSFWLSVTYVGLPDYVSQPFNIVAGEVKTLGTIAMKSAAVDLTQVTVTAKKPIVEVHPDKTVFNVEGSINATGNNALELLRKAPGVVVDNNDNIMMSGKNGVQVYIDGKPSPLSASDLAAFLKTLQSNEIATIEIITNPSAKYDAEGNAGIINIRIKKDKRLGANANVSGEYSIGKYPQYNGSVNGNYRNKHFNAFGRIGYSDYTNYNYFDLNRDQFGISYDQANDGKSEGTSPSYRLGADFFLGDKQTVGFLVNGSRSDDTWRSKSFTSIYRTGQTTVDSILDASSLQETSRDNYNFNLNYRFDNTKGLVWNIDADYGLYRNDGEEDQPNNYYLGGIPTGTPFRSVHFANNSTTDIDIATFKVDHERPFLKGNLGAGFKIANVQTDNDFDFYNLKNSEPDLDEGRSRKFGYTENVNAAYLSYGRQFEKFGLQLGLRAEQTNAEGDLRAYDSAQDTVFERNYLNFFPSGGLTYQVNPVNSLQLTYSRRIDRPTYQDMNPFENRLDEKTFERGNPNLNPQYTNSFSLSHTYKFMYTTTLSYSRTTDLITRLVDIDQRDTTAGFITWDNLGKQSNLSLGFSIPVQLTKWLNAYTNFSGYRQHNRGDFSDETGTKEVDLTAWAVNGYAQLTFSLPLEMSFELSGWYNSPAIWGGNFKTGHMGSVDAGLQKKVLQGKGNLKLAVSDIFKTTNWAGETFFGQLHINGGGGWDSRRFRASFTYLLGNDQVKAARRRSTGLEDEQNRIKSDN